MRILLIEDDEFLSPLLLQSFKSQNYVVDAARDGQSGWEYAQNSNYDLIVMDVGLPKIDGITLCQRLRENGCSVPILLMTGKDDSTDIIQALDAGADDYLIKPLKLEELKARSRALLRRGQVAPTIVVQVGNLRLNPQNCMVTYEGKPLALTPKEYSLLEIFLRNPSRVFSRGQLVELLWTYDDPPLEESVKAHIKGLRQKLKAVGVKDWIENVYGLGYRLREGVGEATSKIEHQSQLSRERSLKDVPPTPWEPPKPSQEEGEQLLSSGGDRTEVSVSSSATLEEVQSTSLVEQKFQQGMNQLWQQYQRLMSQRLASVQAAAKAIETGSLSPQVRQEAAQAAHKLAGVLGMFERETGTLWAREIEQILLENQTWQPNQKNQFLDLVNKLTELLEVAESNISSSSETSRLLLIDADKNLGRELQQQTQALNLSWQQATSLELAKTMLESFSPDLVVLAVDALPEQEDSLALVSELAARTPPVPVIVLASDDELWDRVTVARAGGQGFLVRPVTAEQIWTMARQLLQRTHTQTVKVLVVDDDPVFLAALRSLIEPWGMRMTALDNPLTFWEVLRSVSPDLLILDVNMPQLNGIELCQAVRSDRQWQGLPIVFLTANRDRQIIQQVFATGADDYVTKPVVGPELLTRITNRLERTRMLATFSTKDLLTGLPNQLESHRNLEALIDTASCFCLAVFNIVELRSLNIQYGHATGNQILQRWGRLFQTAFRGAEILGYWGNGEFVVGMPELTKQQAGDRLNEFLITLRQQVFTAPDGSRFRVRFSCAIAEYPSHGKTLQSLYQFVVLHNLSPAECVM